MKIETVSLDSLINKLFQNPGLVLGPGCTVVQSEVGNMLKAIRVDVQELTNTSGTESLEQLIDVVRSVDIKKSLDFEERIKNSYRDIPVNFDLDHIARCGWSAVVSMTSDMNFETQFANYLDGIPSSKSVTVVSGSSMILPQRTTPIYKLFGSSMELAPYKKLVTSASDIFIRQQQWPHLLRDLADYVRGSPLIFLGTAHIVEHVKTVLGILVNQPPPSCRKLIFLKGDETYLDQTVSALLAHFEVEICDASVRDIAAEVANMKPAQGSLNLSGVFTGHSSSIEKKLECYTSIMSLVPNELPSSISIETHRTALVDSLFRPISVDWPPFLLNMDLRRSITTDLVEHIGSGGTRNSKSPQDHIVVRGEAGVGKTAVMKRLAVELSEDGYIVIWFRRRPAGIASTLYKDLVYDLKGIVDDRKKGASVIVFLDNPKALGIDIDSLADMFETSMIDVTFLHSFRNSDYFISTTNGASSSGGISRNTRDFELPFELDDNEVSHLPEMLVTIGVATDLNDAKSRVKTVQAKNARDILCSLWYLIPETKFQISQSLTDEYLELGDIETSVSSTASGLSEQSATAKRAYEAVTVISNLELGIPVEVLVRYLKIEYSEWLDLSGVGRPIWGLVYAELDNDETSTFYRTRNEVVTSVLLTLVNGGAVGHTGEARVISELIAACSGGTSVYRDFITSLLITSAHKLRDIYNVEQGIELYDCAREAMQFPDRALELHKGLWMARDRSKLKQAYEQLQVTLESPEYPGSDRHAPVEHVHNSMAANVLQMIKSEQIEVEAGRKLIEKHLQQASSTNYFSSHSWHVSANLYYEMSQQFDGDESGSYESLAKSLNIIEMALQKIGCSGGMRERNSKSVEILKKLRDEIIINYENIEELKQLAKEMYDKTKSAAGFILATRVVLADAIANEKGKHYNKAAQYIEECIQIIGPERDDQMVELKATRLDLFIRWKLQKPNGVIDWQRIRDDSDVVIKSDKYGSDPIRIYYSAIAHFHLGDTSTATALFSRMRSARQPGLDYRDTRNWYVGPQGFPKRCQCEINQNQGRHYALFPEIGIDLQVVGRTPKGGAGASAHAYIAFSLDGASVKFEIPRDTALIIP